MPTELQYEVGRHDASIQNLEREVHAMRNEVAAMRAILEQARGGWKLMVSVGTISGAIGASVAKFWAMLKGLG